MLFCSKTFQLFLLSRIQADDDSYIFVENLREFLGPFAPNEKLFFGFPYLSQDFGTYMSGGSGYVLSHESLRQFHGQILNRTDIFADFFSWSRAALVRQH